MMSVGGYIAFREGIINSLLSYDTSYLSFVILILMSVTTLYNGAISFNINKLTSMSQKLKLHQKLKISDFISSHCFTLGMIGTIVGFLHLIFNISNSDDVQNIVISLKTGLGTALFTTLTGLIANIVLSVQNFNIRYDLEKKN